MQERKNFYKIFFTSAEYRKIPDTTLYNYFLKRILVVFQRAISEAIYQKVFIINGHMDLPSLYQSFSDQEIVEQTIIH